MRKVSGAGLGRDKLSSLADRTWTPYLPHGINSHTQFDDFNYVPTIFRFTQSGIENFRRPAEHYAWTWNWGIYILQFIR